MTSRELWNLFAQELLPRDQNYEKAFRLWVQYYWLTESFDRLLTSRRQKDGTAGLLFGENLTLSNKYAREQHKHVLEQLGDFSNLSSVSRSAMKTAGYLSFEELERLVKEWKKES